MRIAMVNIPLRLPADESRWITVPPQGYGGIQWVVAHLVAGLLELGHEVFLLGAPGSPGDHPGLTVVPVAKPEEMVSWLRTARVDMVHDHSDGKVAPVPGTGFVSTHHLTTRPVHRSGCVYLSRAQRAHCGGGDAAPVVPIPVDLGRYPFAPVKEDFLLFLGRVSPHKGALEAAAFARAAGSRLVLAGPSWEPAYLDRVLTEYGQVVEVAGEVGGAERARLLASARALMVLSQPAAGPWGGIWCEPGATVVSEAAAGGTPVLATANGCLPEIVPPVGALVGYGTGFDPAGAKKCLAQLPSPARVRAEAAARWDHVGIAERYVGIYRRVLAGESWT
ncbi:glycosyltransferase [Streptomyces polygonati]|uniref:D-inositol 3-phosphate glycosyltransferase n=1 Tax=Streptomyces polygonati TaxID=1617087 RepID=A0ABV8HQ20_9ACTN